HQDGIRGNLHCWIPTHFAASNVVLPLVPRTGNNLTLERALAERSAAMKTHIVQRVDRSIHIEEGDEFSVDFHGLARPWLQVRKSGNWNVVGHGYDLRTGRNSRGSPGINISVRTGTRQAVLANLNEFRGARLSNPDVSLELLNHLFVQPNFRGPLGEAHAVDLLLQLKQAVEEIFRSGRATEDVDIHRHDLVDPLQDSIRIKRPANTGTGAHRDAPFWIRHLFPDKFDRRGHFQSHRTRHNHQVSLAGTWAEDLGAETGHIEPRGGGSNHFDGATREAKSERPQRGFSRPVENIVHGRNDEVLFVTVFNVCHKVNLAVKTPEACTCNP